MTFFIVVYFKDHIHFNEYPHREMKLYIPFCGCENDNIHSRCFCCNMIILFCKLLKIKLVQTSLCKGTFLAGEAV